MRPITVLEHMSLDGVMQSPGAPDEDTSGGFDRGGWGQRYADHVLGAKMAEGMAGAGELLLGRTTYDQFFSFWPRQSDNPYTEVLNRTRKWVVTSRPDALPWQNSTGVDGGELKRLRDGDGPGLMVLGSGTVVTALREQDLVDRYVLVICPLVLGQGKRLFPPGLPGELRLVESLPTTTGVIVATYEPVR
jgi:dihydrofolate reductase